MQNVFLKLLILCAGIFSVNCIAYQELSSALNPEQYNYQLLAQGRNNKNVSNATIQVGNELSKQAVSYSVLTALLWNKLDTVKQLYLIDSQTQLLLVHQRITSIQSYFLLRVKQLKYSISSPKYHS